jgi:antitoxin (DNA-binding transcriptional repressor) of toxin-antitoxin stability system
MMKVTMTEFSRKTRKVLDLVDREGRVALTYRGRVIGTIVPSPASRPNSRARKRRDASTGSA